MVGQNIVSRTTRVTDMTQDLGFEKAVLIGTAIMALFLFIAHGLT